MPKILPHPCHSNCHYAEERIMNEIKRISFLKTSCQLIFVMFLTFVICFYKAMSCLSCYPFIFMNSSFLALMRACRFCTLLYNLMYIYEIMVVPLQLLHHHYIYAIFCTTFLHFILYFSFSR